MKKLLVTLTLILSCGVSFAGGAHQHHHTKVDVSAEKEIPEITLVIHKDASAGWNLELVTKNFEFTPLKVNKAHVLGEGHAHLYIDGTKIGRLYGNWHHLSGLEKGAHSIKVSLNTNNHGAYSLGHDGISAEIEITE